MMAAWFHKAIYLTSKMGKQRSSQEAFVPTGILSSLPIEIPKQTFNLLSHFSGQDKCIATLHMEAHEK